LRTSARRILDERKGRWRKYHTTGSFTKYNHQGDQIKVGWVGETRMREVRNYNILVGKPKVRSHTGNPRPRLEDNTKIYVKYNGYEGVD
jgi:hypothetical protein